MLICSVCRKQEGLIAELREALEVQKDDNRNLADQVNRMAKERDNLLHTKDAMALLEKDYDALALRSQGEELRIKHLRRDIDRYCEALGFKADDIVAPDDIVGRILALRDRLAHCDRDAKP